MNIEDVKNVVLKTIAKKTGVPVVDLKPDNRLDYDLGLDSLDMVEIEMELEGALTFPLILSTDFDSNKNTIDQLISIVHKQVAHK